MSNENEVKKIITVAVMGGDYYARFGISQLLTIINERFHVKVSTNSYQKVKKMISEVVVNLLIILCNERNHTSSEFLKKIRELRSKNPEIFICMCSTLGNSLEWLKGNVDDYISLRAPLYKWRTKLLRFGDSRYRSKNNRASLTSGEMRVVTGLGNGMDLCDIAELENLTYHRVSALKNSVIRKLGLRNKIELLVFLTR